MRVCRLQVYPPGRDYHIVAYSSIDVVVQTEAGYAVIVGLEWLSGILAENRAGGVDWIAVTTARMKGWKTKSFREKSIRHHRRIGTAERSVLSANFLYGQKDYCLGGSLIWQLFRAGYRMTKKPVLTGGLALLFGYCFAALRRMERPVTPELMQFHRREQMKKLRAVFRAMSTLKKVDNFSLTNTQPETR